MEHVNNFVDMMLLSLCLGARWMEEERERQTNKQQDEGEMEEHRSEEPGHRTVVLGPGAALEKTDGLGRRIGFPQGSQRPQQGAVAAVLQDQELWRPLLHSL
jgi:hypothetical protein